MNLRSKFQRGLTKVDPKLKKVKYFYHPYTLKYTMRTIENEKMAKVKAEVEP